MVQLTLLTLCAVERAERIEREAARDELAWLQARADDRAQLLETAKAEVSAVLPSVCTSNGAPIGESMGQEASGCLTLHIFSLCWQEVNIIFSSVS